jgi:hypothetical protein
MKRLQLPLYTIVIVTIVVLTGAVLGRMFVLLPPMDPYDITTLELGTQSTVVIAMSSDCTACRDSMAFYKSLMQLPEVDGTERRVVVVAMDGNLPVSEMVESHGFRPHRLTSGPYSVRSLPGVSEPGTVLLLDPDGQQIGKWVGPHSEAQQREIVAAIRMT